MNLRDIGNQIGRLLGPAVVTTRAPSGDGVRRFVREGYEVHDEKGPRKHQRRHVFADVRSLASYLNWHVGEQARQGVDVIAGDTAVVAAVEPDDVTADIFRMEYRAHPLYEAWRAALDKPLSQVELLQHVRAVRESLGEEQAQLWTGVLGVLKVVKGGHMEGHVDERGFYRLRGGEERREVATSIPPTIQARLPLFDGVEDTEGKVIRYDLEVLVEFEPDSLAFRLTAPESDLVRRRAVHDVAEMLDRELGDGFLVVRGEQGLVAVPTGDEVDPSAFDNTALYAI